MSTDSKRESTTEQLLSGAIRGWQRSSVFVLAAGLVGLIVAAYVLARSLTGTDTIAVWARFLPALVYGFVAVLLLANFYWSYQDAVIEGMKHEVIQQKIEAELNRELSLLDPTTEVYNRRYLRAIISKEASRAKRYAKGLSVMMVDITGFRRVNESLGHTGGDVVLREVAHLLQTRIRNADYIVRFGGDEFLLILPDTDQANAEILARRIQLGFLNWTEGRGFAEFGLRLAVGVASYVGSQHVEEMLSLAEQRMLEDRRTRKDEIASSARLSASE